MESVVWAHNVHSEIIKISSMLNVFPVCALDVEFPGFLKNTPRYATEVQRFEDMVYNVNNLKPIQLGLTLCNEQGRVGGVWQINLRFDLDHDLFVQNSIDLLIKNGIDFDEHKKNGVDPYVFTLMFSDMINRARSRNVKWITFHGLYDLGYFLKLATGNKELPKSECVFVGMVGEVFGAVYDVKFMARFCEGLLGGELGLERMANILKVERVGQSHQAGSDSFVTACAYLKMKEVYGLNERVYQGFLYGIQSKIENKVLVRQVVMEQQQQRRQRMVRFPVCSGRFPAYVGRGYGGVPVPVMNVAYVNRPVITPPPQFMMLA